MNQRNSTLSGQGAIRFGRVGRAAGMLAPRSGIRGTGQDRADVVSLTSFGVDAPDREFRAPDS